MSALPVFLMIWGRRETDPGAILVIVESGDETIRRRSWLEALHARCWEMWGLKPLLILPGGRVLLRLSPLTSLGSAVF